jgi:putative transcriptional regulator
MPANYHSKICAIAHNAMEQLFAAGLLHPQSMYEFDLRCRTDAGEDAHLAQLRQETAPIAALSLPQRLWTEPLPAIMDAEEDAMPPLRLARIADEPAETIAVTAPHHAAKAPAKESTRAERPAPTSRIAQSFSFARPSVIFGGAKQPAGGPAHAAAAKPKTTSQKTTSQKAKSQKAPARPQAPAAAPAMPTATPLVVRQQAPAAKQRYDTGAMTAPARPAAPSAKARNSAEHGQRTATLPRTDAFEFNLSAKVPDRAAATTLPSAAELRSLREREGVSEAVFARCLKVQPQTVIAWEAGKLQPNTSALRLLAKVEAEGLNAIG